MSVEWRNHLIGGGFALMAFLGADFVQGRDDQREGIDHTLREVLDLKLSPISENLRDLKTEVRALQRDADRRISALERNAAMQEARQALEHGKEQQ